MARKSANPQNGITIKLTPEASQVLVKCARLLEMSRSDLASKLVYFGGLEEYKLQRDVLLGSLTDSPVSDTAPPVPNVTV